MMAPARALAALLLLGACGDDSASAPDAGAGGDGAASTTVTIVSYVGLVQANVLYFAWRDGDGPWSYLAGAGGVYTLEVTSGRYGVAWVCYSPSDGELISSWEVTVTEAPTGPIGCHDPDAPRHTVSGTVSGLQAGETAILHFGPTLPWPVTGTAAPYSVEALQGTWDVAFLRTDFFMTDLFAVERDFGVRADTTLNFSVTSGVPLESHTVAVMNGATASESLSVLSSYVLRRGGEVGFDSVTPAFVTVPAASRLANEVHGVTASVTDLVARTWREFTLFASDPADPTFTLPLPFMATHSVASSPPVVLRATFPDDPADVYELSAAQDDPFPIRLLAYVSSGRLPPGSTHTYDLPDLSAVPGWDPSWNLEPGVTTRVSAGRLSSNRGVAGIVKRYAWRDAVPAADLDGLTIASAGHRTELVP